MDNYMLAYRGSELLKINLFWCHKIKQRQILFTGKLGLNKLNGFCFVYMIFLQKLEIRKIIKYLL